MRHRILTLTAAAALALTSCGSPDSLAPVMDTCDLPQNSWIPDSEGITVVTYGVAPVDMATVDCILSETGTSDELRATIMVNGGPHPQPRHSEEEDGYRYGWSWRTEDELHLIVEPS